MYGRLQYLAQGGGEKNCTNSHKNFLRLLVQFFFTAPFLHGQYEVSGRSSKNSDLLVEQFSVWVKHYYAVSFLSFGSYSAHFLDFKLDSAQTEI